MTAPFEFTDAQRSLIGATESTYVEACPGAGKTRTIVERYTNRPAQTRRGVALISFTNAVTDEARERCIGEPDLLRAPNFIGTIDSFVNNFIVGPLLTSLTGITHTFHSTWQHLPGSTITANGVRAQLQLDWFDFALDGPALLSKRKIPSQALPNINKLEAWMVVSLESNAKQQWLRNVKRGQIDAAASRIHFAKHVENPLTRQTLKALLGSRFAEVIVDEVQDCSREDVALLQLLQDAGVRLILVGDPEQAIYGFRGGSAHELTEFLASITHGPRMNGNFRSSPAICEIVNSLRSSTFVDSPVGPNRNVQHLIHLIKYSRPKDIHGRVSEVVQQYWVVA